MPALTSITVTKASLPVPKASVPVPEASITVPEASIAVTKASVSVPKAAISISVAKPSTDGTSVVSVCGEGKAEILYIYMLSLTVFSSFSSSLICMNPWYLIHHQCLSLSLHTQGEHLRKTEPKLLPKIS